jgi:phosphotransferase system enzyme I (PtsP)
MLKVLLRILQEVSAAPDLSKALRIVVERTKEAMETDAVSIFLADYEHQEHVLMATEGLNKNLVGKTRLKFGEGLVGIVGEREQPINLDDAPTHPNFRYVPEIGEEKYHAFLGVPIIHQRQLLGILVAQQQDPRKFDEDEEAFLVTLSAQLAGAIAHAQATGMLAELKRGIRKDTVLSGLPGAPGIAIGKAVVIYPLADLDAVPDRVPEDSIKVEIAAFRKALKAVQKEIRILQKNIAPNLAMEERALFGAYLKILTSTSFIREVNSQIRKRNWAQGALKRVIQRHIKNFEAMEDSYLRERAADLRDLGQRILFQLQASERTSPEFPSRAILIGEEVTPAALAEVPKGRLAGVVSVRGSTNSHVAVLARALNIPAVMGVQELPVTQLSDEEIIVDGYYGQIYLSPSQAMRREFRILMKEEKELDAELEMLRDLPAQTTDGYATSLYINLGLIADIERLSAGAEGVGLYRTEVPFMIQDRFPSEEEQRIIYRQLLQAFAPRPVMMRTLDVGGDKALPYFPVVEDNPFLGWRGIRITLDHPEIFLVQLRAMLRASVNLNNLHIMLPMVSGVSEVIETGRLLNQAYDDLVNEGLPIKLPALGVMIEIPSAVYQARELAQYVDFLSVGSNDLTQYLLAVDRNNARVANLYDSLHPAVLKALMHVVEAAHSAGKHASICGEMAGDPAAVLLLIAMGFDSLSMSATRLLRVKCVIRKFSIEQCKILLKDVLTMTHAGEIRHYLERALKDAGLGGLIRAGGG